MGNIVALDKEQIVHLIDGIEEELKGYRENDGIIFNHISPRGVAIMVIVMLVRGGHLERPFVDISEELSMEYIEMMINHMRYDFHLSEDDMDKICSAVEKIDEIRDRMVSERRQK